MKNIFCDNLSLETKDKLIEWNHTRGLLEFLENNNTGILNRFECDKNQFKIVITEFVNRHTQLIISKNNVIISLTMNNDDYLLKLLKEIKSLFCNLNELTE